MKSTLFWIPGHWLGKLAITARPRGGDWLNEEVKALRTAGIDVLVSLLEPTEVSELGLDEEGAAANSAELSFVNFPIPDRSVPADFGEAQRLLTDLQAELRAGRNVAVHCRQSVGRAGLIAVALLILEGDTEHAAVQSVTEARGLEVPETPAQLEWLSTLPQQQLAQLH